MHYQFTKVVLTNQTVCSQYSEQYVNELAVLNAAISNKNKYDLYRV